MKRTRRTIQPRARIFVGCEGESERSYVAWLREAIDADGLNLHLDAVLLKPGAGDPLRLVELAVRRMREQEDKRGVYRSRAILLDADRREEVRGGREEVARLADEAHIQLIWQEPNHEALLLRHLPGCETLRPSAARAEATLRQKWPDYTKGVSARRLAAQLRPEDLRRALRVEAELAAFLAALGFRP